MIMVWHLCGFKLLASVLFLVGFIDITKLESYPAPDFSGDSYFFKIVFPFLFCLSGVFIPVLIQEIRKILFRRKPHEL
jgi:hypothetical protein